MQDKIFKIEKIRGIVLAEKIRDFRVTSVIKARNSRTGTTCTYNFGGFSREIRYKQSPAVSRLESTAHSAVQQRLR